MSHCPFLHLHSRGYLQRLTAENPLFINKYHRPGSVDSHLIRKAVYHWLGPVRFGDVSLAASGYDRRPHGLSTVSPAALSCLSPWADSGYRSTGRCKRTTRGYGALRFGLREEGYYELQSAGKIVRGRVDDAEPYC